jgi:hypothetical protein
VIGVAAFLNCGIVEAASFGKFIIERDNLRAGRVEPVSEILFYYNLISHCESRLIRDAALVRLVTVLVARLRAVFILLHVAEFRKGIVLREALRTMRAFPCQLKQGSPLSQKLWAKLLASAISIASRSTKWPIVDGSGAF